MPKKISPEIRRAIERNAHKPWGAPEMQDKIRGAVENGSLRGEIPSVRTISGILGKARQQPVEDRLRVTEVSWPQSFQDHEHLLPWSAAPTFFELFQLLDGRRPLMPLMLWFWRVTQAAPDAPPAYRQNMAAALAIEECLPMLSRTGLETAQDAKAIETYLAFAPWRSEKARQAYEASVPKDRQFDAGTFIVGTKSNVPEASLMWYAIELRSGVFTLDARDSYMNYARRAQDEATAKRQGKVDTSTRRRARTAQ